MRVEGDFHGTRSIPSRPRFVVGEDKRGDGCGEFRAVAIGFAVDDLLLERAVEAFDDAVVLGFADEGETGREGVTSHRGRPPLR